MIVSNCHNMILPIQITVDVEAEILTVIDMVEPSNFNGTLLYGLRKTKHNKEQYK